MTQLLTFSLVKEKVSKKKLAPGCMIYLYVRTCIISLRHPERKE